jgi:DNA topoisomerase-3
MESILEGAQQKGEGAEYAKPYAPFAKTILGKGWIKPNKRVFDNTKVSDHFAIIPTLQTPKNLSEPEQKLYDLVVKRFLAVFFPAAEFLVTTRITNVQGHCFKTEGKVLVEPGWLAIYGKASSDDDTLIPIQPQEVINTDEINAIAQLTRPPARYTEATLLSAMESAGKLVDDDDLREAMGEKGLGTPATRAAIIEGLLAEKYLIREARELIPTAKAFQLLTLLRGLGVKELTMPELTGEWEFKLSQMEKGKLSRDSFMSEIANITQNIVERAKNYTETTIPGDYATLTTPCPKCKGIVKENYRRFSCTNTEHCDFSISKVPGGRQFEIQEVEQLLRDHHLPMLDGFRSKMGRPFSAVLKLTDDFKLVRMGSCPKCGSGVFDNITNYICEKALGKNKSCDFKTGKVILQQAIDGAQMSKLLETGKTDLLTRFVSSKTKRSFKAYLVLGKDGKVGFEFEAREKKRPGKTAATKS